MRSHQRLHKNAKRHDVDDEPRDRRGCQTVISACRTHAPGTYIRALHVGSGCLRISPRRIRLFIWSSADARVLLFSVVTETQNRTTGGPNETLEEQPVAPVFKATAGIRLRKCFQPGSFFTRRTTQLCPNTTRLRAAQGIGNNPLLRRSPLEGRPGCSGEVLSPISRSYFPTARGRGSIVSTGLQRSDYGAQSKKVLRIPCGSHADS